MAAGFLIVIPAQAEIQGVRDADGFRAPARGRAFAGMTEAVAGYFHGNDGA